MTDTKELVERVRPLLNNIAMEFCHDELCRTNSGWPDIVAKGCNCSRREARDALAALSELEARLDEKDDAIAGLRRQSSDQAAEAIAWRARAEAAENLLHGLTNEADANAAWKALILRAEAAERERDELKAKLESKGGT